MSVRVDSVDNNAAAMKGLLQRAFHKDPNAMLLLFTFVCRVSSCINQTTFGNGCVNDAGRDSDEGLIPGPESSLILIRIPAVLLKVRF